MAKSFTKEEKQAIEIVLGMGFTLTNEYAEELKSTGYEYEIVDRFWVVKEYKSLSSALVQFLKYGAI